jgi:hypothetical protein
VESLNSSIRPKKMSAKFSKSCCANDQDQIQNFMKKVKDRKSFMAPSQIDMARDLTKNVSKVLS